MVWPSCTSVTVGTDGLAIMHFISVSASLSNTDSTCIGLGLNLGHCGYRPATNRVSHGTVCYTVVVCDIILGLSFTYAVILDVSDSSVSLLNFHQTVRCYQLVDDSLHHSVGLKSAKDNLSRNYNNVIIRCIFVAVGPIL